MKVWRITSGKFLVTTRRLVSLALLLLMAVGFVSAAGAAVVASEIVEKAQIVPMILAGSFASLTVWLAATLLFGRIYCSTICPLGTLQDIAARMWRLTPRRAERFRYKFTEPQSRMQISWAAVVLVIFLLGQPLLIVAFDPCSVFARTLQLIFGDSLRAEDADTILTGTSLGALATLIVLVPVVVTGLFRGRPFCNSFCPVGGGLAAVSKFSLLKIDINTDLCIHCNRCIDVCKAGCISPDDYSVDTPRCVVCFDCLKVCPNEAIAFTSQRHRLSTPMMMSTTNNMEITQTSDETISSTPRRHSDKRN